MVETVYPGRGQSIPPGGQVWIETYAAPGSELEIRLIQGELELKLDEVGVFDRAGTLPGKIYEYDMPSELANGPFVLSYSLRHNQREQSSEGEVELWANDQVGMVTRLLSDWDFNWYRDIYEAPQAVPDVACKVYRERSVQVLSFRDPPSSIALAALELEFSAVVPELVPDWMSGGDATHVFQRFIVPAEQIDSLNEMPLLLRAEAHCVKLSAVNAYGGRLLLNRLCGGDLCTHHGPDVAGDFTDWDVDASQACAYVDPFALCASDEATLCPPGDTSTGPGGSLGGVDGTVDVPDTFSPEVDKDVTERKSGSWGGCGCRTLPSAPQGGTASMLIALAIGVLLRRRHKKG